MLDFFNKTTTRALLDTEQLVHQGYPTKWLFMIKPISEGNIVLNIKVEPTKFIINKFYNLDLLFEEKIIVISELNVLINSADLNVSPQMAVKN